ncbi:cytochrome c biogenesis protein ResB [Kocuria sp.]|uniref:cytochrome c biogenesis protein ResB n=1 Tax=Kocuria sp. TaxID=1871328 RepID=UPI0026E0CB0F|nr:cytochrome c biogenesis protein ResB [Kocuria sp.]MDO5617491.1 cytochrome c biogenesis protein ResB [Kocuria sp.]
MSQNQHDDESVTPSAASHSEDGSAHGRSAANTAPTEGAAPATSTEGAGSAAEGQAVSDGRPATNAHSALNDQSAPAGRAVPGGQPVPDGHPASDGRPVSDGQPVSDGHPAAGGEKRRLRLWGRSAEGKQRASSDVAVPALGFLGMVRWAWSQLTRMNTALFLLLLLAVAAVPGSIFPQRVQDVGAVNAYIEANPTTGPILDQLQFFDVFSSVWFSAIYLLLFISLVGCVIPRARKHWQAWRAQPPRTPAKLRRLPVSRSLELGGRDGAPAPNADQVIERAAAVLKKRRYRVDVRDLGSGAPSVGAERGMWKEVGNILFHLAMVGILIFVAYGSLFGFKGQKILTVGDTFANSLISYDSFTPGSNFNADWLEPFTIRVDDFTVEYNRDTSDPGNYGIPLHYESSVTITDAPGEEPREELLTVNRPISVDGVSAYLIGNGYAPVVRVTDGEGNVSYEGPVVTVPEDTSNISSFTLKVPDASPQQLGFTGTFLPTAWTDEATGQLTSADPDLGNPALVLSVYSGDLGLDDGTPQNVYVLDVSDLNEVASPMTSGGPVMLSEANPRVDLPNGLGTIEYLDTVRYVGLDLHYDPGTRGVFISFCLAFLGLIMSLFIVRRRAWVRVNTVHTDAGDRLVLEYGLLARGEDPRLEAEAENLVDLFTAEWEDIGVRDSQRNTTAARQKA